MFTFNLKTKILFGHPVAQALPAELAAQGIKRPLLVSDPGLEKTGLVADVSGLMSGAGYAGVRFTAVSSNPTTDEVAAGLQLARATAADGLVALGGGSPIDVAKGIAMLLANGGRYADYQWGGRPITRRSAPLIAVPTTAGTGSEVSKVAVVVDPANPLKKGVLSPLMFPQAAIVDPQLTRTLPAGLTAATGMDALIHALEAYIGRRANPFTDQLALAGLEAAVSCLPQAVADGGNMAARETMMLAALWGGMAMDHAGLGLVHSLSGPLSGYGHLHHGLANALLLPDALQFNAPGIRPAKLARLRQIFGLPAAGGGGDLAQTVREFCAGLGLPTSLGQINLRLTAQKEQQLAAETLRMVLIQNNPLPVTEADCVAILRRIA